MSPRGAGAHHSKGFRVTGTLTGSVLINARNASPALRGDTEYMGDYFSGTVTLTGSVLSQMRLNSGVRVTSSQG